MPGLAGSRISLAASLIVLALRILLYLISIGLLRGLGFFAILVAVRW